MIMNIRNGSLDLEAIPHPTPLLKTLETGQVQAWISSGLNTFVNS